MYNVHVHYLYLFDSIVHFSNIDLHKKTKEELVSMITRINWAIRIGAKLDNHEKKSCAKGAGFNDLFLESLTW